MSRYFLFVILFVLFSGLKAQSGFGGKLGLNIQFGTHIQRFGFMYQIYYYEELLQFSNGAYFHFNKKNLGPDEPYVEIQNQFGLQVHWLEGDQPKYYYNELANLSPYRNSLGYSFTLYWSGNSLSQSAGIIHVALDDFQAAIGNDAFGLNQVEDKFRTGGIYLGYQVDSALYGFQSTLWTGRSSDGNRVEDPSYPSRFGYRDIEKALYGRFSHGLLSLRADFMLNYDQTVRAEAGIDAEQIRHFIQNKIIHDGISGRLVKSQSPHYPMLQKDGTMYLYKENQKIRPVKPYLQLSANQPVFY